MLKYQTQTGRNDIIARALCNTVHTRIRQARLFNKAETTSTTSFQYYYCRHSDCARAAALVACNAYLNTKAYLTAPLCTTTPIVKRNLHL